MQVSIEKKDSNHCTLNIQLPACEIDHAVSKKIKDLSKTAKIKGFIPGKVPVSIIKKEYGKAVRMEILEKTLTKKYSKAILDNNLDPININIEIIKNEEGKEFEFNVHVELFPKFNFPEFDKIKIYRPKVNINKHSIDKMIEHFRLKLAIWNESTQTVSKNNRVIIDFIGKIDGKEFKGGSAKDFQLIIGSNSMVPEFEHSIIGMEKNDDKIIDIKFPEKYHNKSLSNKKVQFNIKLKKIEKAVLPEINEEFINKIGIKSSINDFPTKVAAVMEKSVKPIINDNIKKQIFDKLVESVLMCLKL